MMRYLKAIAYAQALLPCTALFTSHAQDTGTGIDRLDGLAPMTDTDNAEDAARTWHVDIHFSATP